MCNTLKRTTFASGVHPALRFVLWLDALVVLWDHQRLQPIPVAAATLAFSYLVCPETVRRLLFRARWLLLASALSFALMTPGEIVPALPVLTYEGLVMASGQVGALVLMLGMVALLSALLPPPAMLSAWVWLLRPLERLGIPTLRVATRAALVLDLLTASGHEAQSDARRTVLLSAVFDSDSGAGRAADMSNETPLTVVLSVLSLRGWLAMLGATAVAGAFVALGTLAHA